MTKAVIFDLDGTLTDSRRNIAESINYARIFKGLAALDENDIFERIDALTFESAKVFYGEDAREEDHKRFEERYEKICLSDLKLYDGVGKTLFALNERGVKMAIATNSTSVFAKAMLAHSGAARYFSAFIGADCAVNPKPAPDMLFLALEKLGAKPSEAVFVGDSGKDMKAAKAAQIRGIFAAWGYGTRSDLADRVIKTPIELLDAL
ncbi:MAG: HAD-IA family hydrolase [Helicobacteraceae bacterium]|jgi:HAD superfamily hydrolase (TIGR01509 family)|nr:HAD-IA family hydrolase [Helicobacteraceae bacterium]